MRKSALLAGAALCLVATPLMAQTAPAAAPAPSTGNGLAEIIVTATKRASNLQNVPVAVTAITASAIQNQRIAEFGDLTRAAASLTLTESTASPNNAIILRGIGTYAFSIGVEPSVAVIIDDVPVVQQAQAFDNMSDVERIEVLRGPQGTLFGKNASAGAINIVTQDVARSLTGSASLTATTDADYKGEASISGPLTDKVGFRLSGYYNNYAGNVYNLTTGKLLNDQESWGIHGKLKIEPNAGLTIVVNGAYSREHNRGTAAPFRYVDLNYVPAGATSAVVPSYNHVSILPDLQNIKLGAGNYSIYQDNPSFSDNQQATVSGKITQDLGFANLISVTSYQDWRYNFAADVDSTDLNVNGTGPAVTNPVGPGNGVNQSGPYHATEFTQELRLASKGNGALSYVVGAFYANAATTRSFTRGPVLILANWHGYEATRSLAAFAGLDYKLPTGTTLSVAGRVNNERIQDAFVNYLPSATAYTSPTSLGTCASGSSGCAGRHVDTVGTWKVAINQQLAPRVSAYGSIATGYKGYAYDISSGYTPLRTANPVQAEHSTSYEIGLKSRWLQNRLQVNIAGFYTNYNNFQAQSAQYIDGVLQQKLNNVGKLRTKGIEVETQAQPTEWLHLDGSFAYTDAKVVSFVNAACYPGQLQTGTGCGPSTNPVGLGNVQDRSNTQLPNSPKFKFNVGATVDHQLDARTKGTFNLTYQHQSAVNFDLLGDPLTVQKAYGIMNAALGLERGNYKLSLFVNNLFDTHYATGMADQFGSYGVHLVTQILPRDSQRYAGIKLGAKF